MTLRELLRAACAARRRRRAAGLTIAAADARRCPASTYDSRQVGAGSVFVALRGRARRRRARSRRDAVARGAVAVVAGRPPRRRERRRRWIQVADARLALAALAAAFYGHPSEELTLVGITGTNGKTTTSYLLASIFEAAGVRCGRIGTVGYRIGDRERRRAADDAGSARAAAACCARW